MTIASQLISFSLNHTQEQVDAHTVYLLLFHTCAPNTFSLRLSKIVIICSLFPTSLKHHCTVNMRSTSFLSGAALLLAGSVLSSDVSSTASSSSSRSFSSSSPPSSKSTSSAASTVSIYNIYDISANVTPDVSIITANPTATVYKVSCPLQTVLASSSSCGDLTTPLTFTQGPSFIGYHSVSKENDVATTLDVSCKLEGTTAAVCVGYEAENSHTDFATTQTLAGTNMVTLIPARITGGAFRISNGTAPHATGSGAASASRAASASGVASGSGFAKPTGLQTTTSGSPTASTSPSATPSHTGAANANAPMLAGAGAVAGLAMAVFAL